MLIGVAAYAALVVALGVGGGVAITPDVVAVGFALVAILLGRGRLFLRDWIPFLVLLLAYELMRGLADEGGMPLHSTDLATADRLIAFGHIPTQVLQDALRPAGSVDPIAILATIVYMIHFGLPLATGFLLWVGRRPQYYDFVAALLLLSFAGFMTYLLLPAAPPWWLAYHGMLNGPDGQPVISYLKPGAFEELAAFLGFKGHYVYSMIFSTANPNAVAAFPSLHVAYPFLTFLFLRRAFGRVGYLALGYTFLVAFAVLYTGDHWVIDTIAGVAYAYVAYYAAVHLAGRIRARWPGASLTLRNPWAKRGEESSSG